MSSKGSVLVIDDDHAFRFAMRKALTRLDYDVREADGGHPALAQLCGDSPPDVALLDLHMDGMDGLEVLRRRGSCPTRIVVLTGHGSVQAAVDAMQLGAFSFLEKPVDAEVLAPLLRQASAETRRDIKDGLVCPPLVGDSPQMAEVRAYIARVGPTDETVAIYGETGTGKDVAGMHVHLASTRRDKPFVAMNAACVPHDLFESELFGHKKGAFTGATTDRRGLFREADGGTLFIDELGELPLESQAKLLRALDNRTIRVIGESKETPVDVRIVAATNRDLWQLVKAGRFREDLYFRLQVFPLRLPPLREHREDIPALTNHLLSRIDDDHRGATDETNDVLMAYEWPGNVRELLNVLRRATLFAEGDAIKPELARKMIAASIFGHAGKGDRDPSPPQAFRRDQSPSSVAQLVGLRSSSLAQVERAHIERVLAEMDGNVTRASQALGIDRRTLQRKLKAYGLSGGDS